MRISKSLRKRYITSLQAYLGGNAKAITRHRSDEVVNEHYLNKAELAKAAIGFGGVFSNEVERKNELREIRASENEKKLEVSK